MAERSEAVEEQTVRDGSATYSVVPEIATAEEVPAGYKRTEVGVIPEDWETKRFGEVLERKSLKSHQVQTIDYRNSGDFPVVDQGQESIVGFTDRDNKVFYCPATGVIVFGDHTCIVKFVDFDFAIGADGTQVLESKAGQCTRFYAYHLEYNRVQPTGYNRHFKFIKEKSFPVPGKEEQTAIATALSDADALIESLDRLIAKKRAIKQSAMQQLLTGQIRLPGFSGEWETKRLGEFVSIRNQKVMPSSVHPDTPCIELEHIGQGDGRLLSSSTAKYSTASKNQFRAGDVLFGRLRSYLRKYWLAEQDGICTTEIWPLMVDSSQAASGFLLGIVQTDRFNESASISYGTHMPRADWKVLKNFEVRLPSVNEQTAIATVLSDMDAEIEALEHRRDKARQIKQGMMQQLLTGRVRLVEATSPARVWT